MALGHGLVEGIPTGGLVVDDESAHTTRQPLADETPYGDSTVLAQPAVVGCGTLGRGARENVETEPTRGDTVEVAEKVLLELLPYGGVVGIGHVDDDTVEAETQAQRVGLGEAICQPLGFHRIWI